MERRVEVAIIGAGSAGISALTEVQKKTDDFLVINEGPYGTTCARVACMPSKALIEAANAYHRRKAYPDMGIKGADALQADLPSVLRHVRQLRDGFVSGMVRITDKLGERSISGRAEFIGPNILQVGDRRIAAEKIIIATGSRPLIPEGWEKFGGQILTSDLLFEQEDLPSRMAVIGLGGTGLELGQALSRLGVEVSGFEKAPSVGGLSDARVNECFLQAVSEDFSIHTGVSAELESEGDAVRVTAGSTSVVVDKVLAAMGRLPNIDRLGLDRLGIETDDKGIPKYNPESLQIGDLPIYIAGDANGKRVLLHEAVDEGHIAGFNAARRENQCFQRRVPLGIVFSDPEIVLLGERPDNLQEGDYIIGEADFRSQSRALMARRNQGCMRLYFDRQQGRLLGAEMAVPDGEHMGHFLATAIQQEMTVFDLLKIPFYHPVVEEGLQSALKHAGKQLEGKSDVEMLMCESTPEDPLR